MASLRAQGRPLMPSNANFIPLTPLSAHTDLDCEQSYIELLSKAQSDKTAKRSGCILL